MAREIVDRQRVIDTATVLADAEGLDAVSLTRVAKILGVRQPALYRHVDGYDDLLRSLGLLGRVKLAEALSAAAIGVSGEKAVRAVGRAWRALVRDHPGLYAATDRYPCAGDPELESAVEAVLDIIARVLSGFELADTERIHVARGLRSALHGFAHLESGDGHPLPHDPTETFDHLLDLLIAGIHKLAIDRSAATAR